MAFAWSVRATGKLVIAAEVDNEVDNSTMTTIHLEERVEVWAGGNVMN